MINDREQDPKSTKCACAGQVFRRSVPTAAAAAAAAADSWPNLFCICSDHLAFNSNRAEVVTR